MAGGPLKPFFGLSGAVPLSQEVSPLRDLVFVLSGPTRSPLSAFRVSLYRHTYPPVDMTVERYSNNGIKQICGPASPRNRQ